jgi:hypothetical protein
MARFLVVSRYSLQGQRYEYLEKEMIDTEYGVDGMVKDRRQKYSHAYSMREDKPGDAIIQPGEGGEVMKKRHPPWSKRSGLL